jgi:hypothetical protein
MDKRIAASELTQQLKNIDSGIIAYKWAFGKPMPEGQNKEELRQELMSHLILSDSELLTPQGVPIMVKCEWDGTRDEAGKPVYSDAKVPKTADYDYKKMEEHYKSCVKSNMFGSFYSPTNQWAVKFIKDSIMKIYLKDGQRFEPNYYIQVLLPGIYIDPNIQDPTFTKKQQQ